MANPATTTELLLQQLVDSNAEIVDLLRRQSGKDQVDGPEPEAPPSSGSGRRPSKKSPVPRPRKGEVRGD